MTELDKFKRRLIRTVARLLRQENGQPDNAVWEQLQKETGCDCQLLWKRMKALTMKKMKRLLIADDRMDNIAAVARMSVTDWLLFDLVLAHEKFDVIGKDIMPNKEVTALDTLFSLIQRFGIEYLKGDAALEAWVNLTMEYNNKGRRASPMLLQRRWYQLKEHTRYSFYNLWYNYRGNQKLWASASRNKPSHLLQAIAKRYPYVVTKPFMEWEELIEKRYVILPEEFENRMRKNNEPEKKDDKPDLVMIEPVIETIDLEAESDDDTAQNKPANNSAAAASNDPERDDEDSLPPFNLLTVKQEPLEDGLSNVQILEATHIPTEESVSELVQIRKNKLVSQIQDFITEEEGPNDNIIIEDPDAQNEEPSDHNIEPGPVLSLADQNNDDTEITDDLIKQKADEFIQSKQLTTSEGPDSKKNQGDDITELSDEVDDIIKQKANDFVFKVDMQKLVNEVVDEYKLPAEVESNSNLAEEPMASADSIEIVDDGIEYIDDEEYGEYAVELQNDNASTEANPEIKQEKGDEDEESAKIDLKLLMKPVVYTTKLDDMIVFDNADFDFVDKLELINSVIVESKPVSTREIKIEPKTVEVNVEPEIENEIIGNSNQNDLMSVDSEINGEEDDISEDDNISENDISEDLKVRPTSYLLRKPKCPTYGPIQLCKNPDFNTRLKRLTAGFFSSARNRQLLSACKPMTIDLHKAFEPKLIDNTLYLKKNTNVSADTPVEDKETSHSASVSVLPSAMPVQSLISRNLNVNINDLVSRPTQLDTVDLTKRSKVINLRDLSEIRRINQHLLTAQVPPMRVDNARALTPSSIPVEVDDNSPEIAADKEVAGESDEPKIMSVSGGQDLSSRHFAGRTVPDPDVEEESVSDGIGGGTAPYSSEGEEGSLMREMISGRGRGRGRGRGQACGPYKAKATNKDPRTVWKSANPKLTYRPPWIPSARPISVTWNKPAPSGQEPKLDDALLTIDTLNRMINKLHGGEGVSLSYAKKKKSHHFRSGDLNGAADQVEAPPIDITDEPVTTPNEETPLPQPEPAPQPKPKPGPKKKKKEIETFCCWAKEKIFKFGTRRRINMAHDCPLATLGCECCCRYELTQLRKAQSTWIAETKHRGINAQPPVTNDTQTKHQGRTAEPPVINETQAACDAIVLSDDESNFGAECTVSTTNKCNYVLLENAPVPKVRVIQEASVQRMKTYPGCSHGNSTCTSACKARGLPMNVSVVSTTEPATTLALHPTPPAPALPPDAAGQKPVLRINVTFAPAPSPVLSVPAAQTADERQILNQNFLSQTSNTSQTRKQAPTIKTMKRAIVIDGGSVSTTPKKKDHDRVVVLNSKNIIKKPKESPIFLGKNKILLTTVKFPPQPGLYPAILPKPPPPPQPKVVPVLSLPAGVQLVIMNNGELSYKLEPGISLTEEQLSVMPSILATLQQHISSGQAQMQELNLSSDSNSTILVDPDAPAVKPLETEPLSVSDAIMESNIGDINQTVLPQEIGNAMKSNSGGNITEHRERTLEITSDIESQETDQTSHVPSEENTGTVISNTQVENAEPTSSLNSSAGSEVITVEETSNTASELNVQSGQNIGTAISNTHVENAEPTSSLNSSAGSEVITVEETSDTAPGVINVEQNKEAESNVASAGSRNLLSDLMEMSGISAEDGKSQETATPFDTDNIGTHLIVRQLANAVGSTSTPIVREVMPEVPPTIIPVENTNLLQVQSITSAAVENMIPVEHTGLPQTQSVISTSVGNFSTVLEPLSQNDIQCLPELTPITSLAELKYACEQDGQFFKLDFDTGIVVPINVSIKKSKPKPLSLVRSLAPKAIIDLTDDVENAPASTPTVDSALPREPVKPVKLFKSSICKQPNLLKKRALSPVKAPTLFSLLREKKKAKVQNILNNRFLRKQRHNAIEANINLDDSDSPVEEEEYSVQLPHKKENNEIKLRLSRKPQIKKQRKNKIEAKIDLVDSDAPIEEEYLLQSSDSELEIGKQAKQHAHVKESSEDSSDDEPLAKKFVRIRETSLKDDSKEQMETFEDKNDDNVDNAGKINNSQMSTSATVNEDTTQKTTVSEAPIVPPLAAVASPGQGEKDVEDEDNINSDEMDLEDSQMVTFLADENKSQEDCILGV